MKKWIALAVVGVVSAGALFVMIPLMMVSILGSSARSSSCAGDAVNAAVAGAESAAVDPSVLGDVQNKNARVVVGVGEQMGFAEQGIVIALSTSLQESGLRMLANDGTGELAPDQLDVARSLDYPHEGVGRDHASVNMFQQQYPWWGTLDELMDPQRAAMKFFDALRKVPGWEAMPVTVAAQTVQQSGFPEAYADDEPMARQLYVQLRGAGRDAPALPIPAVLAADVTDQGGYDITAEQVLCGSGSAMNCRPTRDSAEEGLTPDALRVMRCITENFGERAWANIGDRPSGVDRDHQEGRAVDAMMTVGDDDYRTPEGRAKGDRIADWVVTHADALGVKYVIWYERIWTRNGAGVGTPGSWAPYDYPLGGNSTDTVAHRDHVHVSVYGNSAVGAAAPGGGGGGATRMPIDEGLYQLTSGYGPRDNPTGSGSQFHAGQDFGAAQGTPIFATNGGTVTAAGDGGDGYGNKVVITDGDTSWLYGHQVDGGIIVKTGDAVIAGQRIGAVGSTGDSTGAHLHYEVRVNGSTVDPMPYLSNRIGRADAA